MNPLAIPISIGRISRNSWCSSSYLGVVKLLFRLRVLVLSILSLHHIQFKCVFLTRNHHEQFGKSGKNPRKI
ncbi:hypothetical protein E1A91_D13G054500v1 [Gossypium mustelinum]|uniref:Uncharacterized protein n=2 Tax=Gossypium TaxID=3633 RepID=A0A5D2RY85_GOSMU|nr:hypothetical protein ES332_D13G054600v1 [Gossypium tomentosum]TYH33367.1 hypothetical protein ES332_D13G054600v1 [Gossypium tomentosum]TYI45669.1 hypothetical protein E1A91_D13G054500v1 [Gossypium mustelinum]